MKKAPQAPTLDDRLAELRADCKLMLVEIEEKAEVIREGFEAENIAGAEERAEELADASVTLMVLVARVVELEKLKGN